jgi:hypothetical protein
MNGRSNKMQRIVRLNQFREELACGELRQAITVHAAASEKHQAATNALLALAQWKAHKLTDGGLDLALYDAALEHEHYAMSRADTLKRVMDDAHHVTEKAQKKMIDAASTTKVSEQRQLKQKKQAELEKEKRQFDQISDVWLNNMERKHD